MTARVHEAPVRAPVAERAPEARRRPARAAQPAAETAAAPRLAYSAESVPLRPPQTEPAPTAETAPAQTATPAAAATLSPEQIAARQQQMAAARASLDNAASAPAMMDAFASAPPTVKAQVSGELGGRLNTALGSETQALQQTTPEIRADLTPAPANASVPAAPASAPAAAPPSAPTVAPAPAAVPASAAAPASAPAAPPVRVEANAALVSDFQRSFSAESGAAQVSGALGQVQTSNPGIPASPGPAPAIPQNGASDPQQLEAQRSQSAQQSQAALAQQQQAAAALPGAERVQQADVHAVQRVDALTAPQVADAPAAPGAQHYLQMNLPADVQTAFDETAAAPMQQSMNAAQTQMAQAAGQRDAQRQAEVGRAQEQTAAAQRQAESDQQAQVRAARGEIETQRQATQEQQRAAVADVERQADTRRDGDRQQFDERARSDQQRVDERYQQAERDSQAEIQRGEQDAERERQRARREAESRSWWQRAVDAITSLFEALVGLINGIFDAVRRAVNGILDAARAFATSLIALAVSFLSGLIAAFGQFLRGLVQDLLGNIFPGLARALTALIDRAVSAATTAIQAIGRGLIAAVDAAIAGLRRGLNAVLDAYQAAVNTAVSLARAALSGDWGAFFTQLLEAACRLAGIDPQQVYAFIGRAQETIQLILDNPGGFLRNVLDAVAGGFRNFAGNFLTHLQAGVIGWLTGALGSAGLQLPQRFDLLGVFSLVAQILGLTWQNVRQRLARLVGERGVQVIEFVAGYVQTLIEGGWAALWERLRNDLATLRDTVLEGIRSFLVERVIMAAVTRLATMFNPVGALVNILIAAYNFYTFLRDQIQRIAQVVQTVVEAVGNIARGVLAPAQQSIESVLARLLPLAIDLLARLIGLGNVGERVRAILQRVQDTIWGAIDRLILRVVGMFRGGGGAAARPATPAAAGGGAAIGERISIPAGAETHTLFIQSAGRQATVMLASEPRPLQLVLQNWRGQLNTLEAERAQRAGRLIDAAERTLTGVDRSADEALLQSAATSPVSGGRPVPARDASGVISGEQRLAANLRELYPLFNRETGAPAQRFERALSHDPFHAYFTTQQWQAFFSGIGMAIEIRTAQSDLQWGRENNRLDVQPGGRPQYRLRLSDEELVAQSARLVAGDGRYIGVLRAGKRIFGMAAVRRFCIAHERLPNDANRYSPAILQRIGDLLVRRGDVRSDPAGLVLAEVRSIRTLPASWRGEDTRNQLYINGSGFDREAENVRRAAMPRVENAVHLLNQPEATPAQRSEGQALWAELRAQQTLPAEDFNPARASQYTARASFDVDHRNPLAQHWSNQGGNNTHERDRQQVAGGSGNLRLLWYAINRGRGAEGAHYEPTVGPRFESQYTRGLAGGYQFIQPGRRFVEYEPEAAS